MLPSGPTNNSKDQKTLLKTFISTFTSEEFIVDLIRITLHPADFGNLISDKSNSVTDYVKSFLKGLNDVVKRLNFQTSKSIQHQISVVHSLLTIRESSVCLLTYDTAFQHLTNIDLSTTKLIQKAIDNRITEDDEFRKTTDNIINIIHAYYEVISVSGTITLFDNFQESILDNNLSPFEALKNYKDLIIAAFNDLSKLQSLNKTETLSDYFIISDDTSCIKLAETLVEYISKGYSIFKTGFNIFDDTLSGIESASTHILAAPSNHGKSIMLVNMCKRMISSNISDFNDSDCVLYITLEDDIYKLSRRFISIFGNYSHESVKNLFAKAYEVTRTQKIMGSDEAQPINSNLLKSIQTIFQQVLVSSIAKITQGKVKIVIKHCNENTFTSGDLGRFIDRLAVDGLKVKMCFVDYLDVMASSLMKGSNLKEYDTQGAIVQEIRTLTRIHKIPIIVPTQNTRDSEDLTKMISNRVIGDSYKKVRFADFIYMMRMRNDKNFLSEDVRPHVVPKKKDVNTGQYVDDLNQTILSVKDKLVEILMPVEMKITKSKDSEKDKTKYLLFCKENLAIYNNVTEYMNVASEILSNSKKLENDVKLLVEQTLVNIATNDLLALDEIQTTMPNFDNIPIQDDNPFNTEEESLYGDADIPLTDEEIEHNFAEINPLI